MRASDIMSTRVVTATPGDSVLDAARQLHRHRISALPVVGDDGKPVGVISEGDLLRRREIGTDRKHRSWWLQLFTDEPELAAEFVKSHASKVSEVMTSPAECVPEDAEIDEVAAILEEKHIKRALVTRDGVLVGIVSRADLVRALASVPERKPLGAAPGDAEIRTAFLDSIAGEGWFEPTSVNVIVTDGIVHLWGWVSSEEVIEALRVAAEAVPGVGGVDMHLGKAPPWIWGY
jgi:CBS domain-containing protein